jgi:hypothetical protein
MIIIEKLRFVLAAIMMIMLSSCQIGTKITVSYVDDSLVFTVTREDGGRACVRSIGVREGNRDVNGPYVWALNQNYADIQSGTAGCQNVFTYGKATQGFDQRFDGKPLTSGKSYSVDIGGAGLTGDADFIAR